LNDIFIVHLMLQADSLGTVLCTGALKERGASTQLDTHCTNKSLCALFGKIWLLLGQTEIKQPQLVTSNNSKVYRRACCL